MSKETEKIIKEMGRKVDALIGRWGIFVEELIVPSVGTMFKRWGIEVDKVFQRVKVHRDIEGIEIDILAVNEEYAVLIEAKSSLSVEDVKEHIERLKVFKKFFPEYGDRKLVGAVAGIVIEEGADKFAYRQGFFVISQTGPVEYSKLFHRAGEVVKILNDEKFTPHLF